MKSFKEFLQNNFIYAKDCNNVVYRTIDRKPHIWFTFDNIFANILTADLMIITKEEAIEICPEEFV